MPHAKPEPLTMPRSTTTSLGLAALLLSDLTLPAGAFAPSGVTFIYKRSFRSSSLSMVFGGGKRKRPDQPRASSFSARKSVVSNSADSESTRTKVDTSNFGVYTVRDAIRNDLVDDVYQKSLHRLLCDGEEECIF
jgi:hypothetical protein